MCRFLRSYNKAFIPAAIAASIPTKLSSKARHSAGPSNSPFMKFCKHYAVDGVSDLGFSINNANKDLGYFVQLAKDLGTRTQIAEGTSANLQAAVDAGMGDGNVPEIFDYFLKLEN